MTNPLQQRFERTLAEIETLRDRLKVQFHLAKTEMRDEWDDMEDFEWDDDEWDDWDSDFYEDYIMAVATLQ